MQQALLSSRPSVVEQHVCDTVIGSGALQKKGQKNVKKKAVEKCYSDAALQPPLTSFATPEPQGIVENLRIFLPRLDRIPAARIVGVRSQR